MDEINNTPASLRQPQPSEEEEQQEMQRWLKNTPAYDLRLKIYRSEDDPEAWCAYFSDKRDGYRSDACHEDWSSAAAAISCAVCWLLEELRDGRITQRKLGEID